VDLQRELNRWPGGTSFEVMDFRLRRLDADRDGYQFFHPRSTSSNRIS
jgi:hypothetical protein